MRKIIREKEGSFTAILCACNQKHQTCNSNLYCWVIHLFHEYDSSFITATMLVTTLSDILAIRLIILSLYIAYAFDVCCC